MKFWIQSAFPRMIGSLASLVVFAALTQPLAAANAMGRRSGRTTVRHSRPHHRVVRALAGRVRARHANAFAVGRDGRRRLATPMAMGFTGAPLMVEPQQQSTEQSTQSQQSTQNQQQNPRMQTQQNPRINSAQNPAVNTNTDVRGAATSTGNSTARSESSPSNATASVVINPASGPPPPPPPPPPPLGRISFGVVSGGALRDWYSSVQTGSSAFSDKTGKFLLGPKLEVYFSDSHRHSVEIDALRRGFGARSAGSLFGIGFSTNTTGSSWEFPVIFKRRFVMDRRPKHMHIHSFVGIGGAYRYLSQDYSVVSTSNPAAPMNSSQGSNTFGLPLAAGLDFRGQLFRFSPELRYTLWTADKSFTPIRTSGSYNANPNQIALVFAFTIN